SVSATGEPQLWRVFPCQHSLYRIHGLRQGTLPWEGKLNPSRAGTEGSQYLSLPRT
ncbi:hypothetical protein Nmel_000988, partial [Mimus melanotis]